MTVASLPEILRCSRCPNISEILLAVSRHSPSSQLRSKILWMGKCFLEIAAVFDLRDRIEGREIDLLALLVALEDEVHTISVLGDHFAQPWLHIVFLAHPLLGPLNGDVVIAGKALDPLLVVGGPLVVVGGPLAQN